MQSLEKIRLQNTPLKKVKKKVTTDSERESEKDMTLDVTAIISFENHKSPGNNSLPAELYKTFIDILKPDVLKLYTEISKREEMPFIFCQTVMSCLCKKGGRQDIANC